MNCWSSCFFSLLFAFQVAQLKGQDLFNLSNSIKYGNYLYFAGEYDLAAREYERAVFLDSTNIQTRIMLLKSYRMLREYKKGISTSRAFYINYGNMPGSVAFETGKLLLGDKQYREAEKLVCLNTKISKDDRLFLLLSDNMLKGDFKAADSLYQTNISLPVAFITDYGSILKTVTNFKYKKPVTSVLMSAIVPGSGKIYSGYWKDGVISFIFIAASAYQSYRGFNKNGIKSAYGWIFGSLAFGFYVGNLYGSGKSANQHNSVFNNNINHQVESVFNTY